MSRGGGVQSSEVASSSSEPTAEASANQATEESPASAQGATTQDKAEAADAEEAAKVVADAEAKADATADEAEKDAKAEADAKDKASEKESPAFEQSQTVDGVKVSVQADAGVFPAGAKLQVKKVSAAVEKKVSEAVDEARDTTREVAASYTFDIKVLDAEGNEVQPADGDHVHVSFATAEVAEELLTTEVYHVADLADPQAEALEVFEDGDVAVAESDGFSTYTVVFSYDKLTYTMAEDTITLDKLMSEVKLTGKINNVTSTNSAIIEVSGPNTVESDASEWKLTAKGDATDDAVTEIVIRLYERPDYRINVTKTGSPNKHEIKLLHMDGHEVTSANPIRGMEIFEVYVTGYSDDDRAKLTYSYTRGGKKTAIGSWNSRKVPGGFASANGGAGRRYVAYNTKTAVTDDNTLTVEVKSGGDTVAGPITFTNKVAACELSKDMADIGRVVRPLVLHIGESVSQDDLKNIVENAGIAHSTCANTKIKLGLDGKMTLGLDEGGGYKAVAPGYERITLTCTKTGCATYHGTQTGSFEWEVYVLDNVSAGLDDEGNLALSGLSEYSTYEIRDESGKVVKTFDATKLTFSDLKPNTNYTVISRVKAVDPSQPSAAKSVKADTTYMVFDQMDASKEYRLNTSSNTTTNAYTTEWQIPVDGKLTFGGLRTGRNEGYYYLQSHDLTPNELDAITTTSTSYNISGAASANEYMLLDEDGNEVSSSWKRPANNGTVSFTGLKRGATYTPLIRAYSDAIGTVGATGNTTAIVVQNAVEGMEYQLKSSDEKTVVRDWTSPSNGVVVFEVPNATYNLYSRSAAKAAGSVQWTTDVKTGDKIPDGSAPNPVVCEVTDTQVTVIAESGKEYSIDGGNNWIAPGSMVFDDLPEGKYKIYEVVTGVNFIDPAKTTPTVIQRKKDGGSETEDNEIEIKKEEQEKPTSPSLDSIGKTSTSITINPTVPGQQYVVVKRGEIPTEDYWNNVGITSENGGSIVFRELDPVTKYDVYTRLPGNGKKNPSPASDPVTVTTDYLEQDAPAKPEANTTPNSITVTSPVNTGETKYLYKLDDGEWQESPEFTGLAAGSSHKVYAKVAGDAIHEDSPASEPLDVTVGKATPGAPDATGTEVVSGTTSITVKPTKAGYEYVVTDSENEPLEDAWTAGTAENPNGKYYAETADNEAGHSFTNLEPGKQYYVHMRQAETDSTNPSPSTSISAPTKPEAPNPASEAATIDYEAETITAKTGYEILKPGADPAKPESWVPTIEGDDFQPGTDYQVRKAAADPIPASDSVALHVNSRPPAPAEPTVEPIALEATDTTASVKVTNAEKGAVYTVTDTEGNTVTVTADKDGELVIDGLAPNSDCKVTAKVPATDSAPASLPTESVDVKTGKVPAAAPTAPATLDSRTSTSITVKGEPGQEYSIDGEHWVKADENGKVTFDSLEPEKEYTVQNRTAAPDDGSKNPSDPCAETLKVTTKGTQDEPSGLAGKKATSDTAKDGAITGVTDAMEYWDGVSKNEDGTDKWVAVPAGANAIENLGVGKYQVRLKATDDKDASPAKTVKVEAKTTSEAGPDATGTEVVSGTTSITVKPTQGGLEYVITDSADEPTAEQWASAKATAGGENSKYYEETATGENVSGHEFTGLEEGKQYYVHVRTAATDDANPSPSTPISAPTKPAAPNPANSAVSVNYAEQALVAKEGFEIFDPEAKNEDGTKGAWVTEVKPFTPDGDYDVRVASKKDDAGNVIPPSENANPKYKAPGIPAAPETPQVSAPEKAVDEDAGKLTVENPDKDVVYTVKSGDDVVKTLEPKGDGTYTVKDSEGKEIGTAKIEDGKLVIDGLQPATDYTVSAHKPATDTSLASAPATSDKKSTPQQQEATPEAPKVSADGNSVTIENADKDTIYTITGPEPDKKVTKVVPNEDGSFTVTDPDGNTTTVTPDEKGNLTIDGLDPVTDYAVTATKKAGVQGVADSEPSEPTTVKTGKASQSEPQDNPQAKATDKVITVNPTVKGQEYVVLPVKRGDDGTVIPYTEEELEAAWKNATPGKDDGSAIEITADGTGKNLEPGTEYQVLTRAPGNDTTEPSEAKAATVVTSPDASDAVKVNPEAVTLEPKDGYEILKDPKADPSDPNNWVKAPAKIDPFTPGATYPVRVAADSEKGIPASDPVDYTAPERMKTPEVPTVVAADATPGSDTVAINIKPAEDDVVYTVNDADGNAVLTLTPDPDKEGTFKVTNADGTPANPETVTKGEDGSVTVGGLQPNKPYTVDAQRPASATQPASEKVTSSPATTTAKATLSEDSLTADNKPQANGGLTYNGTEQPLVTAPKTVPEGYAVKYGTSPNGPWSENIPTGKDANADGDSYPVYVQYEGDADHDTLTLKDPISVSIAKKPITDDDVSLASTEFIYSGSEQGPVVTVKVDGITLTSSDCTLSGDKATDKGEHTVTVTATPDGNYTGEVKKTYKINAYKVDSSAVKVNLGEGDDQFTYDGTDHRPDASKVTVEVDGKTLVQGQDYDLVYPPAGQSVETGGYEVKVVLKGNYEGETAKDYSIVQADASELTVDAQPAEFTYSGQPQGPVVTVKHGNTVLTEGVDYDLSGATATAKGDYKVTVVAKGNFTGTTTADYKINAYKAGANDKLSVSFGDNDNDTFVYDGTDHRPAAKDVKVELNGTELKQGEDYDIEYSAKEGESVNAGSYEVKIVLKGNYASDADSKATAKGYKIAPQEIDAAFTGDEFNYEDNKSQGPVIIVKGKETRQDLTKDADYTLAGDTATEVGDYTVTVKGTGNYTGSATHKYTIKKQTQDAPAPVDAGAISQTDTTITIDPTKKGQEYVVVPKGATSEDIEKAWNEKGQTSKDGEALTFDGLNPDTDYEVLTRMPGDATHEPSEPASTDTYTTDSAPADGDGYTTDYPGETIEVEEGYEIIAVTPEGTQPVVEPSTWTSGKTSIPLTPGTEYQVRKKADPDATPAKHESEPKSFMTEQRPDAPDAVDGAAADENSVTVQPSDPAQEYLVLPVKRDADGNVQEYTSEELAEAFKAAGKNAQDGVGDDPLTFTKDGKNNPIAPGTDYVVVNRVKAVADQPAEGDTPAVEGKPASLPTASDPVKTQNEKPAKPEATAATDDNGKSSVTVKPADEGAQYVVVKKGTKPEDINWDEAKIPAAGEDSVTFDGLEPGEEYVVVARTPETGTGSASDPTEPVVITTPKAAPATAPAATGSTDDEGKSSITVDPSEKGQQYVVVPADATPEQIAEAWEKASKTSEDGEPLTFDGLEPGKDYKVLNRYPGDEDKNQDPSPANEAKVTTPKAAPTDTPKATSATDNEKGTSSITVDPSEKDQQYVVVPKGTDPDKVDWTKAQPGNGGELTFDGLTPGQDYEVLTRYPGNEETGTNPSPATKSDTVTTPKAEQDAPAAEPAAKADSSTSITVDPAEAGEEYSIDGGKTWVKPEVDPETGKAKPVTFDGLTPGKDYEVVSRKAGSDTQAPSPASEPTLVSTKKAIANDPTDTGKGSGTGVLTDGDGNPVDKAGNPLVEQDGKYYQAKTDEAGSPKKDADGNVEPDTSKPADPVEIIEAKGQDGDAAPAYNGKLKVPDVVDNTVKDADGNPKRLQEGTDFTVAYYDAKDVNPDGTLKEGAKALSTNPDDDQSATDAGDKVAIITFTEDSDYEGTIAMPFTIAKRVIHVITEDESKVYDGTPLVASKTPRVWVEGGVDSDGKPLKDGEGLVTGQRVEVNLTGSQSGVGSSDSTYEIVFRDASETSEDASMSAQSSSPISSAASILGTQTALADDNNGLVEGNAEPTAKSGNYTVVPELGKLTIQAKALTDKDQGATGANDKDALVKVNPLPDGKSTGPDATANTNASYTGGPIAGPELFDKNGNKLAEGTDYDVKYYDANGNLVAHPSDAGTYKMVIEYKGNYTGTYTKDITIEKAQLTVKTPSASKKYDGKALTATSGKDLQLTGLMNGETATLIATGSQTKVGESDNTYAIKWDGTAKESNYTVVKEDLGKLTVESAASKASDTKSTGKSSTSKTSAKTGDEAPFGAALLTMATMAALAVFGWRRRREDTRKRRA